SRVLDLALRNGEFLMAKMVEDKKLYRTYKSGLAYTPAFLEDYAAVIQALIHLYQVQFDQKWLERARQLADYTLEHFYDPQDGFFFFNNPDAEQLIANKKELFDNVIPSSNSMMARNLHQLGLYFYNDQYSGISKNMLGHIKSMLSQDVGFLANWANLYLEQMVPTAEVAVAGLKAKEQTLKMRRNYFPNLVLTASEEPTDFPPLLPPKAPDPAGNALTYVCFDRACQKPVPAVKEAVKQFPTLAASILESLFGAIVEQEDEPSVYADVISPVPIPHMLTYRVTR